jgi:hypothetical protein
VALDRIAECALQRLEIRLEIPPLFESVAIERLADLFRARGADASLGLVELDASRLELEAAEVEDSTDRAVDITDNILVMNAKDLSG